MSALLVIRRLHLYLGLFLLPWVVLFGISSYPFSHPVPVQPKWTVQLDRPYTLDIPPGADLRALGARIQADAGLSGGFYVNQPNATRINVQHADFFRPTRITYFIDQHRLLAEQREVVWRQVLTGLHARNGYELDSPGNTVWAVAVDATCVALLLWIASGLVMWWLLPGSRTWGFLALAAGILSFAWMLLVL